MAGLYDRIGNGLNVHYLVAGLRGYAAGLWTEQQVLNGLNSLMETPLAGAELTDLAAIADEMDAASTATAKLVYGSKVEAVMIAAEAGVLEEAGWRAGLEIS